MQNGGLGDYDAYNAKEIQDSVFYVYDNLGNLVNGNEIIVNMSVVKNE